MKDWTFIYNLYLVKVIHRDLIICEKEHFLKRVFLSFWKTVSQKNWWVREISRNFHTVYTVVMQLFLNLSSRKNSWNWSSLLSSKLFSRKILKIWSFFSWKWFHGKIRENEIRFFFLQSWLKSLKSSCATFLEIDFSEKFVKLNLQLSFL